jgi:hypothetical protein
METGGRVLSRILHLCMVFKCCLSYVQVCWRQASVQCTEYTTHVGYLIFNYEQSDCFVIVSSNNNLFVFAGFRESLLLYKRDSCYFCFGGYDIYFFVHFRIYHIRTCLMYSLCFDFSLRFC